MATLKECRDLEKQLDEARKEYNQEHSPCTNWRCTFYRQYSDNHCTFYHYVEECRDYTDDETNTNDTI